MSGVDIHDQLRMQRYSIQHAYKPKKYSRSIFFGLVDMAIVNAFIVHRHHMKNTGQKAPEHCKFMETLHEQLRAIDDETIDSIEVTTAPTLANHFLLTHVLMCRLPQEPKPGLLPPGDTKHPCYSAGERSKQ